MVDLMSHAAYFDSLVDMIPARHYLDPKKETINLKHMKKADKKAVKRALKAEGRKNKRQKLDPDAAVTTVQAQQQRAAQTEEAKLEEDKPCTPDPVLLQAPAKDMEELRERLQAKIQGMRKQRNADEQEQTAKKAKAWREKALSRPNPQQNKQRPKGQQTSAEPPDTAAGTAAKPQEEAPSEAPLSFGNIEGSGPSKKRKLNKEETLKELEGRGAAAGPAKGGSDWKGAMARARGQKVLDNAAMLKRAVKREKKGKEKRSQAWKDRIAKQDSERNAQQVKRQENLKRRIDKKVETKKARREKKLMRPGFEGRRDTFIS